VNSIRLGLAVAAGGIGEIAVGQPQATSESADTPGQRRQLRALPLTTPQRGMRKGSHRRAGAGADEFTPLATRRSVRVCGGRAQGCAARRPLPDPAFPGIVCAPPSTKPRMLVACHTPVPATPAGTTVTRPAATDYGGAAGAVCAARVAPLGGNWLAASAGAQPWWPQRTRRGFFAAHRPERALELAARSGQYPARAAGAY
jgi:hypothetical protein